MKFNQKMAALLVTAMIVTIIPNIAFAQTTISLSDIINQVSTGLGFKQERTQLNITTTGMIVVAGKNAQRGGEILLEEGATEKFNEGTIEIELPVYEGIVFTEAPTFEVTEGDLELGEVQIVSKRDASGKIVSQKIEVPITKTSTTSAAIEIVGFQADVAKTTTPSSLGITLTGSAFGEEKTPISIANFITIEAKELDLTKNKVKFVMNEKAFKVNEQSYEMDTEAYIKGGRTMIPVKYLSVALGIGQDDIEWDHVKKTATIYANQKTIVIEVGSKNMLVNDVVVPMLTAAEIKDNRTIVPVAEIARVLEIPTTWDNETKTASFN